jgi:hypothetical protein
MIYLIITTSIYNKDGVIYYEHRKNRYIECINSVLKLIKDDSTIKPIIVENNGVRETYLDGLNCDVIYTNNNFYHCKNKAVNELLDIKQVINQYNIQDDDFIIKLSGRYKILNLLFINLVKYNCNKYDAFIKFFNVCTLQYLYDDCVLGLFAIKCCYLKKFEYECIRNTECGCIDNPYCECIKSPEWEFASYIRKNIDTDKLMEITDLNLECCFAYDLQLLNV